jgi:hypothetical protein
LYDEVLTLNYFHSRFFLVRIQPHFSPPPPKENEKKTVNGGFSAMVIISSLERVYPAGCFTRYISLHNNFLPSVPIVHASLTHCYVNP